jgi:hypothetical protein
MAGQLLPLLIEPLGRDRFDRAELLGEQRNAQLLEQPTVAGESRSKMALILLLAGEREVGMPARVDLLNSS